MNDILYLKGDFKVRNNNSFFGSAHLPKNAAVTVSHIESLIRQLSQILMFWESNQQTIGGALISVHYKHVVAKSNRLQILLGENSKSPNDSIRGVRFEWENDGKVNHKKQKHVFTHFISLESISQAIDKLELALNVVKEFYNGHITHDITINLKENNYNNKYMSRTTFLKVILDVYHVERFSVDNGRKKIDEESIITIYQTKINTSEILSSFGIDMINAKMINETTFRLQPKEIEIIQERAPYLIAMDVKDWAEFNKEDLPQSIDNQMYGEVIEIPEPSNEPVVGVIDTQFDTSVYFNKWVEYKNMLTEDFEITSVDCEHGTAVTSIIVDGPSFNPKLDDGCGRFRVRHFGVAKAGRFSSFTILKLIRIIVSQNRDIKVWNLSLGSAMEIDQNFISPEAAELDRIQSEYDVIFIVAGTNKKKDEVDGYRIGAPADSLNSLVVNSVDFDKNPASYTRVGPVLSFFHKPDISYYGGTENDKIVVCEPLGQAYVTGTSYAAPWITRKMAYLIHIMKLSREIAKALIIDSAAGWKRRDDGSLKIGYGVVPIRIEDILHSSDNEIRFIMNGTIDAFETYTYNIPVPQNANKHPFIAKATLVYFPKSERNQGVDYTSTEMDIHFGRIKINSKNNKPEIKPIDNNVQSDDGPVSLYEEEARKLYRKWDNVKHISEGFKKNPRGKDVYGNGLWGLSIKTKERLEPKAGRGLQFGVVVTLKEINGANRIDDFIKMCVARGWIVNKVDIEQHVDIYNHAEEELILE